MEKIDLFVIYCAYIGKDTDGLNIYHFLVNEDPEPVFAENWEQKPSCNCGDLKPSEDMYEYVKELRTEITLDLAQDNCCFSMQDCRDNCVALAYENLDNAEEYPEEGRIVIHFGDNLDEVEAMLARRDLVMKFI